MTAKLYTAVVSFTVVVEAADKDEANAIIDNLIDNFDAAPDTYGVLGWDDVEWNDPGVLTDEA